MTTIIDQRITEKVGSTRHITLPDTSTEKGQREASVMLAKLMPDWTVREGVGVFWIEDEKNDLPLLTIPKYDNIGCKTLYDPANMALAWRVLNWWDWLKSEEGGGLSGKTFFVGFGDFETWMKMLPAEALRRWLDKILALAVEEGMI